MNDFLYAGHVYDLLVILLGALFMLAGWLTRELSARPLSPPIVYIGFGLVIFAVFDLPDPNPLVHSRVTERVTELIVIIALVIAGLKLDRPVGLRSWSTTWRLLAITMPLSIAAMAFLGWYVVCLVPASAILLGAVLAPTDPVLAGDVQVGPPLQGPTDEVRFGLTSEAGLNDGLAFPFTNLAIAVAVAGVAPAGWVRGWVLMDVLYKVGMGMLVGLLTGYALTKFLYHLPFEHRFSQKRTGFVALAITLLVYGITELLNGYGFIAVFVAPLLMRHLERDQAYHEQLHDYAEETEQMLRVLVLFLFGGAIARGLLEPLTWAGALTGIVFLLVVRPLFGFLGLAGTSTPVRERLAVSFFGIRGIGSFYYLAFGLNHGPFEAAHSIWAVVAFVVLCSVVIHGICGSPFMRSLDRRRRVRDPDQTSSAHDEPPGDR